MKLCMLTQPKIQDTAGPRGVEAAMAALSNLALIDNNVPLMLKEGVVDMVMATMDFHCGDPNAPQPRVLHAAVALLGRTLFVHFNLDISGTKHCFACVNRRCDERGCH